MALGGPTSGSFSRMACKTGAKPLCDKHDSNCREQESERDKISLCPSCPEEVMVDAEEDVRGCLRCT